MDTNMAAGAREVQQHPLRAWLYLRGQALVEVLVRMLTVAALGVFLYSSLRQYILDPTRVTVLLMVVSEVVTIIFSMFSRVPRKRDWNAFSVLISTAATFYFLAFKITPGIHLIPEWIAVCVQVAGMMIHISAKLTLRRSFGILPANRGVVVRGPYRFIRHPMYFGYIVRDIGFMLPNFGVQNLCVVLLHWTLQIGRILREEKLLSNDEAYRDYTKRVRYRVIFGLF
jgi:protein-S-isoprenylcysteine O-methyltransferase Ste14